MICDITDHERFVDTFAEGSSAAISAMTVRYNRSCLLSLRPVAPPPLGTAVLLLIRSLGLRRHRGCRAGRSVQFRATRAPSVFPAGNGAYVVNGYRPAVRPGCVYERAPARNRNLIKIPTERERHAKPVGCTLVFGCMNVRSLSPSKLDSLLVELDDRPVDVLLLCETWHDADSVAIRRLRADGYSVVERARPRTRRADESLSTNHGGVAVIAAAGVRLTPVDIGRQPTSFECVAARVLSSSSSCVVVVVYRPGSTAVTAAFFTELADVLDRLATFADPIVLAGDVNIRLERSSDPNAVEFCELLAGYGLVQHVHGITHDAGGTLDVVCTRDDLPSPAVDVIDIGLSDHRLLRWSTSLLRPPPVYVTSSRRPWRSFDADIFRADLLASALCDEQQWSALDGDGLVKLYDDTIATLLDRQIPSKTVTCRRRPSNPWFDDECRCAKRSLRSLERSARRAGPLSDTTRPDVVAWRTERRRYFDLLRSKRSEYWTTRVDSEQQQPRRLWQSFEQLLGRGKAPTVADIDASALHHFFDEKVAGVRNATAGAPAPQFTTAPVGCELRCFQPVMPTDVIKLVRALPDKQCSSDPLPTWLLKAHADDLAPFLTRLFCWSLEHGSVPSRMKSAYITPIVKKGGMDSADAKSYRPISNLSVLSKLLERLVSQQLLAYLKQNDLLPNRQSAYRAHHSTETAVLRVLSDILLALDSGNIAVLALLDLSAAFDSVDHATLLQRLRKSYGLDGSVIAWFASYLNNRTQHVRLSASRSTESAVLYGVPQGSVLGPILFLLYTADVLQLVQSHQLNPHAYADDTQIYGSCHPSDANELQQRLSVCVDDVSQ